MVDARQIIQSTTEAIEEFSRMTPDGQMEWVLHNPLKALAVMWFLLEYYNQSEGRK